MSFVRALLFAIVFSSAGAQAAGFSDQFVKAGLTIPMRLHQLGYDHFGSLYLQRLINDISAMISGNLIRPSEGWDVADKNGDGRATGHWEIHGTHRTVEIDMERWRSRPADRPLLALHEFLGAFGYVNENKGWISTEMWFLTEPETRSIDQQIVKNVVARIAELVGQRYAGGVVGVGGGGEIDVFHIKSDIVRKDLAAMARATNQEDYQQALNELGADLESDIEVQYHHMTKAYQKRLNEVAKPHAAICVQRGIICNIGKRSIGNNPDCHCPGHENDEPGVIGFPGPL